MADPTDHLTNGASAAIPDVEMSEDVAPQAQIEPSHATEAADITDPNPPPQPASSAAPVIATEHLSTIQPVAASTPPPASAGGSTRPGSMPPQPSARPEKPAVHGGPTRQFLNQNITPHLLEGMKYLAAHEPEKPLLWLADFLRDRSKEVEG